MVKWHENEDGDGLIAEIFPYSLHIRKGERGLNTFFTIPRSYYEIYSEWYQDSKKFDVGINFWNKVESYDKDLVTYKLQDQGTTDYELAVTFCIAGVCKHIHAMNRFNKRVLEELNGH